MGNEKMKILKMLEDGLINANEAAKLLEAAGNPDIPSRTPYPEPAPKQSAYTAPPQSRPAAPAGSYPPPTGARPSAGSAPQGNQTRRPASSAGMESFADEVGRKFETFVKDFEPTLQKISEIVTEKTAQAADKIQKTLATPTAPPRSGRPPEHPRSYASGTGARGYDKEIELRVAPGSNELILTGCNAPVLLKGYNGDKISAKLYCVPKRPDARIELSVLGSKYFLDYDEDAFEKVAIDAFIPENLFKNINVSVYNGDLNLSTISAGYINAYATAGSVTLDHLYAESLKVECENGKEMRVSNIYADNALIENYNGGIAANNIEVSNLKLSSFNGAFNMNAASFDRYHTYVWVIEASNHKLNVNLPTLADVGYYLKAKTSLGNVKIGLTGLNYIANTAAMAEAKTIDYDARPKKVNISLETSNAQLVVN